MFGGGLVFFPLKISLDFQRVSLERREPPKNQEGAGGKERPRGKVISPRSRSQGVGDPRLEPGSPRWGRWFPVPRRLRATRRASQVLWLWLLGIPVAHPSASPVHVPPGALPSSGVPANPTISPWRSLFPAFLIL